MRFFLQMSCRCPIKDSPAESVLRLIPHEAHGCKRPPVEESNGRLRLFAPSRRVRVRGNSAVFHGFSAIFAGHNILCRWPAISGFRHKKSKKPLRQLISRFCTFFQKHAKSAPFRRITPVFTSQQCFSHPDMSRKRSASFASQPFGTGPLSVIRLFYGISAFFSVLRLESPLFRAIVLCIFFPQPTSMEGPLHVQTA